MTHKISTMDRMRCSISVILLLTLLLTAIPPSSAAPIIETRAADAQAEPAGEPAAVAEHVPSGSQGSKIAPGKLPLAFVPNKGQTDPAVHFQAQAMGGTYYFTPSEVVLSLGNAPRAKAQLDHAGPDRWQDLKLQPSAPTVVRLRFDGATKEPEVAGAQRQPGVVNYLLGNDRTKWRANVPTFSGVTYKQLYPGIDLSYEGKDGHLKSTYTVAPSADPGVLRWRYQGTTGVRLQESTGDLIIGLSSPAGIGTLRELTEEAPIAWQDIDGARVAVDVRYTVGQGGAVGFKLGRYDRSKPLIIDPVLTYSSYLGGAGDEYGRGVAVDGSGNAYVVGYTASTNFPTATPKQGTNGGGAWDIFVTKVNPSGSALVYSTYLGGAGDDRAENVALDTTGNAYITGMTTSTNLPTAAPLQTAFGGSVDAFVTKLSSAGSALTYSTYLGGSGDDRADDLALDSTNNVYITGFTRSTNFHTVSPLQTTLAGGSDVFVSKLNAAGSALTYSTYLGGGADDQGQGIDVDSGGNAYVTGYTNSTNFRTAGTTPLQTTSAGGTDAFVSKVSAAGNALTYSTYLGGGGTDNAWDLVVDGGGAAYIAGGTASTNFPTVSPLQAASAGSADAFVSKVNTSGSGLLYSTYVGGSGSEHARGIALDPNNRAYVTGHTSSTNFRLQSPSQAAYGGGTSDAFLARLWVAGNGLVYSSYLGGSGGDDGRGIAVDGSYNAFVAGHTNSTNFPTASPRQGASGGVLDAFVAKIAQYAPPVAQDTTRTTSEDTAVAVTLTATDTDSTGLNFALGTATNGTLDALPSAAGTCSTATSGLTTCTKTATYRPNANYRGTGSFTYTVSDSSGAADTGTASVTISPVNDRPTGTASLTSLSIGEDAAAQTITLSGSDVETAAASLKFKITVGPTSGQLRRNGTPLAVGTLFGGSPSTVTYQPNANFNGSDSFKFTVTDTGDGASAALSSTEVTIPITVSAANDAPGAADRVLDGAQQGVAKTVTLSGSDIDGGSLTFEIVAQPTKGTLSTVGAASCTPGNPGTNCTASITYTATASLTTGDSFTYKAYDGALYSSPATVRVTESNAAPVAQAQSVTAVEDTPKVITLGATDADGDTLTYTIVAGPSHGILSGAGSNRTYDPAANYNGPDSFTFKVNDGAVDSNVATVSLTVGPANDRPALSTAPASLAIDEDAAAQTVTLTATDVETAPAALTFAVTIAPAHGTLRRGSTVLAAGDSFAGSPSDVTYQPAADYNGQDSFAIKLTDSSDGASPALSDESTLAITIIPINEPPTASASPTSLSMDEDAAPQSVTLTGSDNETGTNDLQFKLTVAPQRGVVKRGNAALTVNSTFSSSPAAVTYTPDTNFAGSDSFRFVVTDSGDGTAPPLSSAEVSVPVAISAANDRPGAEAKTLTNPSNTE